MKRINTDPARTQELIRKTLIATDDHQLTPEQRARAELRLRQLRAVQKYELRQSTH